MNSSEQSIKQANETAAGDTAEIKEIRVHYVPDSHTQRTWRRLFGEAGFQILATDQDPDIIILKHIALGALRCHILSARKRFGWKPLLCLQHSEPYRVNSIYKYLDFILPHDRSCEKQMLEKIMDHRFDVFPKTRFCNFIHSNSFTPTTRVRIDFCKKLMEYKQVDCPGSSLNNMPLLEAGIRTKTDFLAHYKFTIAFENTSVPRYISEKIFHPLRVGSIPIYWGCPEIAQYVNPDCFINCHDFSSFDDVIREVIKIDRDQQLYESYLKASPLLPSSRCDMTKQECERIMRAMTEAALLRRTHYRENKLLSFCRKCQITAEVMAQQACKRWYRQIRRVAAKAVRNRALSLT